MDAILLSVHGFRSLGAAVLLASVWQGTLLTFGVAVGLRLVKGVSPATRAFLWTAVMVLILLLPALALMGPHAAPAGHGGLHVAERWSVLLLAAWGMCSAFRAVQLGSNAFGLWRLASRSVPVRVNSSVSALLKGSRAALLCVSDEINRPSVVGFFRPRVLLPAGLLETLAPTELEHVVRHEMEHLRRHDDWLNLLQQISLVLLPLHPALLWLDRQLCRERELACDDGVLAATGANKAYAACLVKLAEESLMRKGMALALSALGTRARESEVVVRVRRILARAGSARPGSVADSGRTRFAVGLVSVAILVGVGGLARSPQLVSFDGAPPAFAQHASVDSPLPLSKAHFALASAYASQASAKPVLTDAVMPQPVAAGRRGSGLMPVVQRRPHASAARATARNARVETRRVSGTFWMISAPVVRPPASGPTLQQVEAVRAVNLPSGRVVVTEFQSSQPLYAAVPWRGGWLIVQL